MWYLPRFSLSSCRSRRAFRLIALAAVLFFGARYVHASLDTYRLRTLSVGSNGDRIITFGEQHDARGRIVQKILRWIDENMEPEATFAVLPEGVMINYLSRRNSTSTYTTFMMTEILAFGEESILYDIQAEPPDYIIIVHKNTSEFGVGFFGVDPFYGMQIMNWVKQQYAPIILHGREPLKNNYFGIKILKYIN